MPSHLLENDLTKLLLALLAGAIIGAEREYKSKSIGFRTIILITLGSCLFTILSANMGAGVDQTRIAANIVTGVGFLGAGAIFKEGSTIKGATTAATIWISAAIGMSIGTGQYQFALVAVFITLIVLWSFTWVQNIIDHKNSSKSYYISISGHHYSKVEELEKLFRVCRVKAKINYYQKQEQGMTLTYSIRGSQEQHLQLVKQLFDSELIDTFAC